MSKLWKWFVYIVECKDGLYYTGMTRNIEERMELHRIGKGSKFTRKHRFKEIQYFEEYSDINEPREADAIVSRDERIATPRIEVRSSSDQVFEAYRRKNLIRLNW